MEIDETQALPEVFLGVVGQTWRNICAILNQLPFYRALTESLKRGAFRGSSEIYGAQKERLPRMLTPS